MSDQIVPKGDPHLGTYTALAVERRNPLSRVGNAADAEMSFVEIWHVLRKRKRYVIMATFGLFVAALAYSLIITPSFQTTSTIEFNMENSDVLPLGVRAMTGDANPMDYHITQDTQARALQSDTLALQVVRELKLEARPEFTRNQSLLDYFRRFPDDSRLPLEKAPHRRANVLKAFHKNLTVKAVPGTRMIKISFLSPDPPLAVAIVNTLVNDFQEQQFRIRFAATAQVADWLTQQLDDLKSKVETSQQKLAQYQNVTGLLGPDETHNIVMSRLEEMDRQLVAAESNRILAQTIWQLAKSGNPELISGLMGRSLAAGGGASPDSLALVENLRAQQSQLKLEYAQATAKYGSEYPKLTQLKSGLKELDQTIVTEVQNLASRAQNDYLAAQHTEDAVRAGFEQAKQEANVLNNRAVQYSILKHEAESGQSLYDNLSKQLKEAGILAGLHSTNIITVDPARPSDRPAKPSFPINLAAGLLAGLVVGVAGAFVVENCDESITTPDQAEQLSMVPALGLVPRSKLLSGKAKLRNLKGRPGSNPRVLVAYQPHSQVAEAYRALRTSILQMTRESQNNVLLFTSALPEDGKTTTSLNCAVALAQQGTSVLLVEADMRRPTLSSHLGLNGSEGLSSLIDSGISEGLPMSMSSVPNLSVIPAGPKPLYPVELLGSPRMAELVHKWRSEYNYVLIDAPPVLSVTDAVVLSPYCDAVILVVRSGVTRKQSLLRVRDLFMRSQTRIAGVVINAFNLKSADHYHYFGYEPTSGSRRGYYIPEGN